MKLAQYDWRNIKAGNIVYVKDWGKNYATNPSFFSTRLMKFKPEWLIRYAYENNMYELYKDKIDNHEYVVLYVDNDKALITRGSTGAIYLIATYTLIPAPVRITKKQIEEELGYPIDIIEEEVNQNDNN